jgi:hypothetical protein
MSRRYFREEVAALGWPVGFTAQWQPVERHSQCLQIRLE